MIREQSRKVVVEEGEQKEEKTQFIVSTFRPELVRAANKCYAITFKCVSPYLLSLLSHTLSPCSYVLILFILAGARRVRSCPLSVSRPCR